jgi:hypothetical protein
MVTSTMEIHIMFDVGTDEGAHDDPLVFSKIMGRHLFKNFDEALALVLPDGGPIFDQEVVHIIL